MFSEIDTIKTKIINKIILVLLIVLTPPYITSILRWIEIGWQNIYIAHTTFFILFILLTIFRKRISFKLKLYSVITIFAVLGLAALWYFGFGGIHYFVIISIAFASIISNRKITILIIAIISVFYISTGYFYVTGHKEASVELNTFSHSLMQWITIILSLVAFSAVFVIGFGGLYRELIENIQEKLKIKTEREKYIMELEITREKLDTSVTELSELNNTKDKFFSIIAHDLISPFSSILGFSQLLYENFEEFDNKKRKAFVTLLHNGILNTYELLEDLLLWSRMQRNSINFNPAKENIYLLSTRITDILKISAEKKSIEIVNAVPPELFVHADGFMVSTVIRNLISNAIKFSTVGTGKIEISAKKYMKGKHKGMTVICVRDNGVGIQKDIQDKLFDVGENHSTPGTDNEKGTGLGLPICYDFIKRNGGNIWVESESGNGSVFCFTLKSKE